MNNRSYLAAGALTLVVLAGSAALAQPYGKGGAYSMAPAPQAADRGHKPHHANCQCPMMSGEAAMREQCMPMSGTHPESSAKPPAVG